MFLLYLKNKVFLKWTLKISLINKKTNPHKLFPLLTFWWVDIWQLESRCHKVKKFNLSPDQIFITGVWRPYIVNGERWQLPFKALSVWPKCEDSPKFWTDSKPPFNRCDKRQDVSFHQSTAFLYTTTQLQNVNHSSLDRWQTHAPS